MTTNTINDVQTIAGGEKAFLVGRYRIVRQLGQGGMGSVWLAEDAQLDGKPFAIKMLPSILVANKRAYNQLKAEALVSMRLTHPNIVTLRAFEENGGNPFLVMDYVDGQTLDDYLAAQGKLSEEETVKLLKPIAAALDYAHGEGVVHRDVKPANVMIRTDGHPFILDFGIAREIQETLTRVTGKLSSGTLLYMSPEQLNGDMPKPAQDVYSFAAMAYECLKGEPPFVRGAIEDQIKNKVPEPLDPAAPQGDGARIDGLSAGVMAGLAKSPEDRPATCAAVLGGGDFTRKRREAEARNGGFSREERKEDKLRGSFGKMFGFLAFFFAIGACGWWWMGQGHAHSPLRDVPSASEGVSDALPSNMESVEDSLSEVHDRGEASDSVSNVVLGAKEEAERVAAEKARRKAEAELRAKEAAARRAKEESERIAAEEARRKAERRAKEEAARRAKEEAERVAAEEARRKAEAERKAKEEAARRAKEDAERVAAEEARRRAEAERRAKEEAARKALEEAARKRAEAEKAFMDRLDRDGFILDKSANRYPPGTSRILRLPNGGQMEMVWCPPGWFMMGSPKTEMERISGERRHAVRLTKGFWIGKYEVTKGQWAAVMGGSVWFGRDAPKNEVSWDECKSFIGRLNAQTAASTRLPTEAEWEYACRAGTGTPFSFGSVLNGMQACCNGGEPYGTETRGPANMSGPSDVGSFSRYANAWGINDMHGNVYEWCEDAFADYPLTTGILIDPKNVEGGEIRVIRGGCWNYSPRQCRSAFRTSGNPGLGTSMIGFRIVCDNLP